MANKPVKNSVSRNLETSSITEHVFRSRLPDIPISNHLPLHTYCFENFSQYPNRTCLIDGNKSYTYEETHLISRRVASGLSNLMGISKNDVVMLLLNNCSEFVFTFFGASVIGAATTTANPSSTAKDIFKQFDACRSKIIVTHSHCIQKLRSAIQESSNVPIMITIDDPPPGCIHFSLLSKANELNMPSMKVEPHDTVALPFSSGTTGMPKGVILTHKSLVSCIAQQVDGENPNFYLKEEDVVLCVLPLFHIYAFSMVLLCSLRSGVAMLLTDKSKIGSMSELIQRHRVSVAVLVPPLVLALAKTPVLNKFDLSSIRMVMSGAAPLGKDLENALLTRLPQAIFGQGYGMTEAGPVITMSPLFAKQPLPTKSGSCGTVVRNADLKVIEPYTGMSLPRNQPGEICIRGPQIMKGYLNNAEATSRTIDLDGWLHTGDIGFVDDDDDVFIVDRIKELIKFKGFQVPPAEIEALLVSHPNIADAAVVPKIDVVVGEVPVAFVVRSDGFELTEEAIKEFIAKQVVFYKRLHSVYFVDAIPRSQSGKILRNELRAKLASSATVREVSKISPTGVLKILSSI